MTTHRAIITGIFSVLFAASSVNAKEQNIEEAITAKFTKLFSSRAGYSVLKVEQSPLPDLYQVVTEKGIFYVSNDLEHMVQGNVYEFGGDFTNHTASRYEPVKKSMISDIETQLPTWKAKDEKHVVTVFTDTTCGYCRKLHSQIDEYNDAGITIKYVGYPRSGIGGPGYSENAALWCEENVASAYDGVFLNNQFASNSCDTQQVDRMVEIGEAFGIRGTPAIYLEDGRILKGYLPPAQLLVELEKHG